MWRINRNLTQLRKIKASYESSSCSLSPSANGELCWGSAGFENFGYRDFVYWGRAIRGSCQFGELLGKDELSRSIVVFSSKPGFGFGGFNYPRWYGSAAEAMFSASSKDDDEIRDSDEKLEEEAYSREFEAKGRRNTGGMMLWKYNALRKRQVKMETEAWGEAAKEYQELLTDMCELKLAPNLPYIKSLFLGWFEPLRDRILKEQVLCMEAKNRATCTPHFDQLPAGMMAVITMHRLVAMLMSGGGQTQGTVRVVAAACNIGEAIEHEAKIYKFLEKAKRKDATNSRHDDKAEVKERLNKKVKSLIKQKKTHQLKKIMQAHDDSGPWGQDAQAKIGARLIELLIETAYIQPPADQMGDGPPDIRPAFIHSLKTITTDLQKTSKRFGVIECDPLVRKGLEKSARHMVIPYMPMLVPPLNWTRYSKGAYLFLPSYMMRTHGARQQREVVKKVPLKQLQSVFEALNTLGNTKWKVNKRVLGIIDRIWATGGRLGDLVDRDDVPLTEEPDTDDEAKFKQWKWKVRVVKKENNERHAQRCDTELKLAVARKMRDEEGFYYPHNLDFRGRAYPMHAYLNHLGSDLCRGILEFAEGQPLGKSGLRWLKIHTANLYAGGVDKLSYDERVAFTESHLDDIFDSADKPLEGGRWWLGAEDPFQCLAVCMNLTEALRSSSPEAYVSHVPVHQDGSCNGLQHYAALGRDKLGAAAVNLVAGDKPADVYSGIAARVLDIMKEDAKRDPSVDPNASHAQLLINQVDRKLVKQTVMTSVYGVTYIGARDQIKRRLKERNAIADDNQLFAASCYAAKITLTALGEMFQAARDIMSWLGDCAKVISLQNEAVQWTTPLGLPVVQPYRKLGRHVVKTSLQVLTLQRESEKVMMKRQRTAFPPNFVHSLDGTHMMMTAISCKKAGLSFAGVHDSYWTHACDVDEMNRILREKFVELYEMPILENLLESFQKSFPELKFPPLPERGDFNLREVLQSPYFFN
ncbi:hypothetical protein Droror1_Dr00008290 [Drosera rotundifolia]